MNDLKSLLTRPGTGSLLVLAAVLLVVLPLALDIFRLNLVGKYLTYGFVAIGLVMLWGHAGILSLGGLVLGLFGHREAEVLSRSGRGVESSQQPGRRLRGNSLLHKCALKRSRVFGAQCGGDRRRIVSFSRHLKLKEVGRGGDNP